MRIEIEFVGGECDGTRLDGDTDTPDRALTIYDDLIGKRVGEQYRLVPDSSLLRIAQGGGAIANALGGGKIPHAVYRLANWIEERGVVSIRLEHLRIDHR